MPKCMPKDTNQVNPTKIIDGWQVLKGDYLLSTRESYGLTAQHTQDCLIFIQLNYVHK